MEGLVYLLSAATAAACSWLLLRAWRRSRAARLLLWSGLCFALLIVSNILLYADKIVLPDVDLALWRESFSLAGVAVLIIGCILDGE